MDPQGPPGANVFLDCPFNSGEIEISGCTIQHNNASPNSANIRIVGADEASLGKGKAQLGYISIGDNVLSDVQVNVEVRNARDVAITGNSFHLGYAQNLLVEKSSNIVVGPNVLSRNPGQTYGNCLEASNALVFRDCCDCTINGLHVNHVYKAEAGLTLDNCRRFNVTGCTVLDCEGVGLLARNLSASRISDCLISNTRQEAKPPVSLRLAGGGGNMIVNNLFGNPYEISAAAGLVQGNSGGK